MAFLSHLSLQSYNFVKNNTLAQDDISVQRQINKYVDDLDHVIKTVCKELNESPTVQSQWSKTDRTISSVERRVPTVRYSIESKSEELSQTIDVLIDYEGQNCIEFIDQSNQINKDDISEFKSSSAFKRYYEEVASDNEIKIRANFTAKQIYSKYFCDYLIHLIEHLAPIMNLEKKALSEAA